VRFGLLGPLEVTDDRGDRRDPRAPRQRRLLLGLLLWRGELVSTDRLVDVVWGDQTPHDPIRALRTYVARLRSTLEPDRVGRRARLLLATETGYRLDLTGHELDVDRFEHDLDEARHTSSHSAALHAVQDALARWRGPALAEVADEPWAAPEAIRLEELRLVARELRAARLLEAEQHEAAIAELQRLVLEQPLRERPLRLLLPALARTGRTGEATRRYRAFRDTLAEETGLDPSRELQRLHRQLLEDQRSDDTPAVARPYRARPPRLPRPRSSLVGREEDVAEVLARLSRVRLLTLTGTGGVGKTRLALEVAHRALDRFPDGVALATLSALRDPALVAQQVAAALGLRDGGPLGTGAPRPGPETLLALLRSQRPLLVVDNAEHLLEPVAALLDRLLDACEQLTVLVTSREPLGLPGERLWHVEPLPTSAADGSVPAALRLLVERTNERRPDLVSTSEDRVALTTICRHLDGIPLALELASARLAHLSPGEVAARLDDHLRAAPDGSRREPRHRTLYATIGWSYDLLADHERALLRDLAAFAAEVSVAAVEGVCRPPSGDRPVVDVLGSLVAKSLVVARGTDHGTRYRLLETVRSFSEDAATAAGEARGLGRRHRDWHLAWLESFPWDHRIASPEIARLAELSHDDLRRALERSRDEPRPDLLARQLRTMSALFCVRGHLDEGRRWHTIAASSPLEPVEAARLAVHRCLVEVWRSLGTAAAYRPLEEVLTAALELLPADDPDAALALALLAACRYARRFDAEATLHLAGRGVDAALGAAGPQLAGFAATLQAGAHLLRGEPELAVVALERAVTRPGWDDRHDGLRTRAHLAVARHLAGDHLGAIADARASLDQLGPAWQHDALGTIAMATAALGDLERARTMVATLLDSLDDAGGRTAIRRYDLAIVAGAVAALAGEPERACRLLASVRWSSSPTAAGTFVAYRDRLVREMDRGRRHAILAATDGLDPRDALAEERARLAESA
jgi:predicted ATPase/DNA-binding SARP family transcriptional activator